MPVSFNVIVADTYMPIGIENAKKVMRIAMQCCAQGKVIAKVSRDSEPAMSTYSVLTGLALWGQYYTGRPVTRLRMMSRLSYTTQKIDDMLRAWMKDGFLERTENSSTYRLTQAGATYANQFFGSVIRGCCMAIYARDENHAQKIIDALQTQVPAAIVRNVTPKPVPVTVRSLVLITSWLLTQQREIYLSLPLIDSRAPVSLTTRGPIDELVSADCLTPVGKGVVKQEHRRRRHYRLTPEGERQARLVMAALLT